MLTECDICGRETDCKPIDGEILCRECAAQVTDEAHEDLNNTPTDDQ